MRTSVHVESLPLSLSQLTLSLSFTLSLSLSLFSTNAFSLFRFHSFSLSYSNAVSLSQSHALLKTRPFSIPFSLTYIHPLLYTQSPNLIFFHKVSFAQNVSKICQANNLLQSDRTTTLTKNEKENCFPLFHSIPTTSIRRYWTNFNS